MFFERGLDRWNRVDVVEEISFLAQRAIDHNASAAQAIFVCTVDRKNQAARICCIGETCIRGWFLANQDCPQ
jgi:hypothetical protein